MKGQALNGEESARSGNGEAVQCCRAISTRRREDGRKGWQVVSVVSHEDPVVGWMGRRLISRKLQLPEIYVTYQIPLPQSQPSAQIIQVVPHDMRSFQHNGAARHTNPTATPGTPFGIDAGRQSIPFIEAQALSETFVAQGRTGQLVIEGMTVTIQRSGFWRLVFGQQDPVLPIPLDEVIDVQFNWPSGFTSGYVRFLLNGALQEEDADARTVARDKYAILFSGRRQTSAFERAVQLVDKLWAVAQQRARESAQQSSVAPDTFVADEIEKLSNLKERGILTEEEYYARKRQLLDL